MKKVGIISIFDNNNYGNRLQSYALQMFLKNMGYDVYCIQNEVEEKNILFVLKIIIKEILIKFGIRKIFYYRSTNFINFNNEYFKISKKINTSNIPLNLLNEYDYFVIGSDQIWNYNFRGLNFGNFEFALFADKNKCFSYAASIGVDNISDDKKEIYIKGLNHLKHISVREDSAKKIVHELTERTDVEVLVDPTMLLTAKEWDEISKKPKQLNFEKYILCYFLGNLSNIRRKEIERVAKEYNCHIINLLDQNDSFYICGPSEFLYLEKHAFLICTDSFHSSVFAILYDRPFIVFDREEENIVNMNSRIETLLSKFQLEDRKYNGISITEENINHDYSKAYQILQNERRKAFIFLYKALKDEDKL